MTEHDPDGALVRAALAKLRADDERDAPAFDAVLSRVATHRRSRLHIRRLAIAAALVLVAVGAYRTLSTRPRLMVPREVVALSAWRPATDVLLQTPGRELLRQSPQLGTSLIDINIAGDFR
jgi:hypothetical protein